LRVSITASSSASFTGHVLEKPVVIDLDDVSAARADNAADPGQDAGFVVDLDPHAYQPTVSYQTAH